MTKTKKLWLILLVSLFVGVMITISEPDLTVLAEQISSINKWVLILSVALGVGIMLVVAMLRIVFKVKLKYLLMCFYAIVFILAFLDEKLLKNKNFELVAVPLHSKRIKQRKYNHMELVCEELGKLTGFECNFDLIKRIKNTKPQYKLNKRQRLENLSEAFEVQKDFYKVHDIDSFL